MWDEYEDDAVLVYSLSVIRDGERATRFMGPCLRGQDICSPRGGQEWNDQQHNHYYFCFSFHLPTGVAEVVEWSNEKRLKSQRRTNGGLGVEE